MRFVALAVLVACGGTTPQTGAEAPEAAPEAPRHGLARLEGTWVVDTGPRAPADLRFLAGLFAPDRDREALTALLAEIGDDAVRERLALLLDLRDLHPDDPRLEEARRGLEQLGAIAITFSADAMTVAVGGVATTQPATVVEETAARLVVDSVREDGETARTIVAFYDDGTIEIAGPGMPPLPFRRAAP